MAKTNAERQRQYRERKKAELGANYLEKERKRQKKYYIKTKELTKNELKVRRENVKLRVRKHRQTYKAMAEETTSTADISPLIITMDFTKKGDSSRKRKRSRQNRTQAKIRKLEKEKESLLRRNCALRVRVHRLKNSSKVSTEKETPRKYVSKLLRKSGLTPRKVSDEIKKSLLFSEALSAEIRDSTAEKRNVRKSIRRLISGKIIRKYKLIKFAAKKTGNDRRKMGKETSKVLFTSRNKRGFDPSIHNEVLKFYDRDDVSTALPGKKDAKSILNKQRKRVKIQKRILNDYLSNLYQKLMAEIPSLKLSFATFARMRPSNFVLANFINRRSCLCTQHQNLSLKLKMMKSKNSSVPSHPDIFRKTFQTSEDVKNIFEQCDAKEFSYEEWKKVPVTVKTKGGEEKVVQKMKIVQQIKNREDFIDIFCNDISKFRGHAERIKSQYLAQQTLKQKLNEKDVYIHMDFAEDYTCRSQEEIQSAYWSQSKVTIHPVVAYFKKDRKLSLQSFVFISDEPNHDSKFVYALLQKLVPTLVELIGNIEFIHYWTDSPTSQYRNKTIFKIISCHEELFHVKASWNYMEAGHGKGPCDPIGGTAKRKADLAVKNDKAVIQDARDFYNWAKESENQSAIKFFFISADDYKTSSLFLLTFCQNVKTIPGTMKIHAILPEKVNQIWVRDTSCFNDCCFRRSIQNQTKCEGWRLVDIEVGREAIESVSKDSGDTSDGNPVLPDNGDYVAAVYDERAYIGKIIEVDDSDVNVAFLEHQGEMSVSTIFREPRRKDEVWVHNTNILCVVPEPYATKRGRKFMDDAIIATIAEKLSLWKKK